jgi:hypothetical protein
VELRLDAADGPIIGCCGVPAEAAWTTVSCTIAGTAGVHDLYLVFPQGGAAPTEMDWWQFAE